MKKVCQKKQIFKTAFRRNFQFVGNSSVTLKSLQKRQFEYDKIKYKVLKNVKYKVLKFTF